MKSVLTIETGIVEQKIYTEFNSFFFWIFRIIFLEY